MSEEKRTLGGGDPTWLSRRVDPVREAFITHGQAVELSDICKLFPPTRGEPAFDPQRIRRIAERLCPKPPVNTGLPLLDQSVLTGLACIEATFQGQHPKYGVKQYAESCHDGFPPTIIAAVDALSGWGYQERAMQLMSYYLLHFVRDDGSIDYRGTSLAELGQLLHAAALLLERTGSGGGRGWWAVAAPRLERIGERLLALRREAECGDGLLSGVPEDDEKKKVGRYFHNNAWVWRGLRCWAAACQRFGWAGRTSVSVIESQAAALAADTLAVVARTWPEDPRDWWLPPCVEPLARPESLTHTRDASYTNCRYWPELLSSKLLPPEAAQRIVRARLTAGGQFCGMTRFRDWLDDWPLVHHLAGLHRLGLKEDFFLSLYGHIAYHQAATHLTAYEQVDFPPGREKAAYCLPCQLVAARALLLLRPSAAWC